MDQLQAEKQQLQQMHPQQLLQPQQAQQQQWFVPTAPHPQLPQQMAQYQNVLLYPPQMFQPYGGIPNMNMNSSVIPIQYSPGLGMPVIPMPVVRPQQQMPVQPQQSSQLNPHPHHHPRGPRTEFRSGRPNTRPQMNGYHQSLHQQHQLNGSAQPSQYNNSSAANAPTSTPSTTSTPSSSQPQTNQTVLNGSQPSTRFPHTRGPRPQHQHRLHQQTGPRPNGNNSNNNNLTSPVNGNRLPYNNQRSVTAIATHMPHQQQHALQSPTGYVQQQLIPAQLYQSPPPASYYSFQSVNAPEQHQQQFYHQIPVVQWFNCIPNMDSRRHRLQV